MAPSGFSVILVPTDRGEPPREVIEVARSLARDGARVVVARVGEGSDPAPRAGPPAPGSALDLGLEVVRRAGPVVEAVIALASELGCELIVIGDDDRAGDEPRLMRGVAQQLLRQAACPVLCLPVAPPAQANPVPYPSTPTPGTFADPSITPGV